MNELLPEARQRMSDCTECAQLTLEGTAPAARSAMTAQVKEVAGKISQFESETLELNSNLTELHERYSRKARKCGVVCTS